MVKLHAEWGVELFARSVSAILARVGEIVDQIASPAVPKEGFHVGAAGLAAGGWEAVKLSGCADDGTAFELRHDHPADEPVQGIELVEPCSPECRDQRARYGHATEQDEGDEHKRIE